MTRYIFLLFTLLIIQESFAQSTDEWEQEPVTINGLKYTLYDEIHEAMLDNGNSWEGELDIPEKVSYKGEDYIVSRIGWLAFSDCTTLTKVRIPKTVVKIQHYLDVEACKNPFSGCTSLEAIEVDSDNPDMCSVDGVLFSKDKTHIYCYPAGAKTSNYTVPDDVTWVGANAFADNIYLKSVEMPNAVTRMCFGAFSGCRNLESVRLPENLKYIESYTFDNCKSLRILDIPQSVSGFAGSVFRWTNLNTLVIRGSLSDDMRSDTFYLVSGSMIVYAQPSEIEKIRKVFSGTVLPLDKYMDGIFTPKAPSLTPTSRPYDLSGRPAFSPTRVLRILNGRIRTVGSRLPM